MTKRGFPDCVRRELAESCLHSAVSYFIFWLFFVKKLLHTATTTATSIRSMHIETEGATLFLQEDAPVAQKPQQTKINI